MLAANTLAVPWPPTTQNPAINTASARGTTSEPTKPRLVMAQTIAPQARTLAEDRGIRCVVVDYDELRGMDDPTARLF